MRKASDAYRNRLPSLPIAPRNAPIDRLTLHEFIAVAAEAPCVQGGGTCVPRWTLLSDLVTYCPPVQHAVLGPAWIVEIIHHCGMGENR